MRIGDGKVVTIDYTLKDQSGETLDSSEESGGFAYLHGADNIISGLETALAGHSPGDELTVQVQPQNAYGHRNESLVHRVPREKFQDSSNVRVGMHFHTETEDGQVRVVRVTEVDPERITVDGNHPLAGVLLRFEVKVLEVRDATEEELAHGHVHGVGGHHHH
jgi:FKBP-type peptidyl-prolyl cis-trans isomerase SlyD